MTKHFTEDFDRLLSTPTPGAPDHLGGHQGKYQGELTCAEIVRTLHERFKRGKDTKSHGSIEADYRCVLDAVESLFEAHSESEKTIKAMEQVIVETGQTLERIFERLAGEVK